ncbi:DMT family transporter [Uliginosibacterium sp. H1]|uniref:DMT family transporter n=1 Tax=Uliginosibacterium sp. H1 TaxID=3114757 RepID=UPI002E1913E3|nr:DMT family transporter [Uliginosibacterium sp. H1]
MPGLLRRLDNPYLLLVLTVLFWSGNWVIGRGIRGEVPPVALAFWRWVLAFLCVLPLAWPHRAAMAEALRQQPWRLIVMALLGITGYNTLTYIGLKHTTATNGVLLNSLIPVVIMALSWPVFRRRLSLRQWLGTMVSLAGVTVVVAHGELEYLLGLRINPGDLWILLSVFVWAAYTVLLQWRPVPLHPMALLGLLCGLGVIGLAPFYAWELAQGLRIHVSAASMSAMLYTGVVPAFLGYVFWNRAVSRVGGATSGLFIHLMPVFTPLLAALFLGEAPRVYHFVGLALIVGGILVSTSVRR